MYWPVFLQAVRCVIELLVYNFQTVRHCVHVQMMLTTEATAYIINQLQGCSILDFCAAVQ